MTDLPDTPRPEWVDPAFWRLEATTLEDIDRVFPGARQVLRQAIKETPHE